MGCGLHPDSDNNQFFLLKKIGDAFRGALRGVLQLHDRGPVLGPEADVDRRGVPGFQGDGDLGQVRGGAVLVDCDADDDGVRGPARGESEGDALRHRLHAVQPRIDLVYHRKHDESRSPLELLHCALRTYAHSFFLKFFLS